MTELETDARNVYTSSANPRSSRVNGMCESTVYLKNGSDEQVLMKEVAAVRPHGGKLLLTSVLGDQLEVEGIVAELDLMGHRIVVERASGQPPRR